MGYKVGDKVRIRKDALYSTGAKSFTDAVTPLIDTVVTISRDLGGIYQIKEDGGRITFGASQLEPAEVPVPLATQPQPLSFRERAAIAIVQGIMSNPNINVRTFGAHPDNNRKIAEITVEITDELQKQLNHD